MPFWECETGDLVHDPGVVRISQYRWTLRGGAEMNAEVEIVIALEQQ